MFHTGQMPILSPNQPTVSKHQSKLKPMAWPKHFFIHHRFPKERALVTSCRVANISTLRVPTGVYHHIRVTRNFFTITYFTKTKYYLQHLWKTSLHMPNLHNINNSLPQWCKQLTHQSISYHTNVFRKILHH